MRFTQFISLGWWLLFALPIHLKAQPADLQNLFGGGTPPSNPTFNIGLSVRAQTDGPFPTNNYTPTLDLYWKNFSLQVMASAPRTYVGLSADILPLRLTIKQRRALHWMAYGGFSRSNDDYVPWLGSRPYPDQNTFSLGSGFRLYYGHFFLNLGMAMDYAYNRENPDRLNPYRVHTMYLTPFGGLGFTLSRFYTLI